MNRMNRMNWHELAEVSGDEPDDEVPVDGASMGGGRGVVLEQQCSRTAWLLPRI